MPPRILIVDDDPIQRSRLVDLVQRFGYCAEALEGGEAAVQRLFDANGDAVDLLILDLVMPDLDGMGVLGRMRARGLAAPTIVQTARGSIEAVGSAMRAGALDFLVKPVGPERLQIAIKNALQTGALESEVRRLDVQASRVLSFKDLAGASEAMERAVRLGARAAKSDIPVLLEGEAGAGKEMIARAIHGSSDRRGRAFVKVNCAGLGEDDADTILFGGEASASACGGARQSGKFVEAQGGALFLDEIGELPLAAQARLVRAIQEGEVDPGAARRKVRIDVRLICATSQNLIERVKAGRFREDLYYRLNMFPVGVPPLRQRKADVATLSRQFCARFSAAEGKRIRGLAAEALALLEAYDWPGNVRQLENALFRAVVLAGADELTVAEFPQIAAHVQGFDVRVPPAPAPAALQAPREKEYVRVEVRDPNVMALLDERGDVRNLESLEADAIRFALAHYRNRMSAVARKLGIGRSTLYRKMKEHGFADAAAVERLAAPPPFQPRQLRDRLKI
ncbi:sigma-54-dependent transcriptional regulator [Methylocapsa palsarum]|uniref:DNA-binding transcriptional regulator NtrC n=1 Tax=Methylocapsa palsarum TaxID=1612308 RepID=A0A1I3VZ40_9HYPH|nr:sigma-54 dependent transcriptional regulator [Methylocapsa palsarum]SFJ99441.1 DNA-binding transcriptional response regulator, NtrC family, contains REC, AAA-type ATPase, and a Fis-type DNA-binding domains [Methylocapsa palsarum]